MPSKNVKPFVEDTKPSTNPEALVDFLNKEYNRARLKADKLDKENKQLRQVLDDTKEASHEKINSLQLENNGLKKDLQFVRSTKLIRDFGTALMAVCGLVGPFVMTLSSWLPLISYYCVATGATVAVILGIWLSRSGEK